MNQVILTGRLTRDPEIRYTQTQKPVARFTLAVDKPNRDAQADFINCTAFDKAAEVICKYCQKGRLIGVVGRIHTDSYQKQDGSRVYTTDVTVDRMEFLGGREESAAPGNYQTTQAAAPAPAPSYQTAQAPAPQKRQEQIPVDWMAEPLTPDADLPF